MDQLRVRLIKPLDGLPEGEETTFDRADAERLRDLHAVVILGEAKAAPAAENKSEEPPLNKAVKPK